MRGLADQQVVRPWFGVLARVVLLALVASLPPFSDLILDPGEIWPGEPQARQ